MNTRTGSVLYYVLQCHCSRIQCMFVFIMRANSTNKQKYKYIILPTTNCYLIRVIVIIVLEEVSASKHYSTYML